MIRLVVDDTDKHRLDKYLTETKPELSRSAWQQLISDGDVLLNNKPATQSSLVNSGDVISITMREVNKQTDISLPIIFENDEIIVINKPHGLLSHAVSNMNSELTVVDLLKNKLPADENQTNRQGVVHRLDRDTSGVMVLAKSISVQRQLQSEFASRNVHKTYLAVLGGVFPHSSAKITVPVGRNMNRPAQYKVDPNGKAAETVLNRLQVAENKTLVEFKPKTGRTHQLRVHSAHIGHPIVGDTIYGGQTFPRLLLHAQKLEINYDGDSKEFTAPIPEGFSL